MAEQQQTETAAAVTENGTVNMKDRKVSWGRLRRVDSLNMEAGDISFKPSTHHASTHQVYNCLWK